MLQKRKASHVYKKSHYEIIKCLKIEDEFFVTKVELKVFEWENDEQYFIVLYLFLLYIEIMQSLLNLPFFCTGLHFCFHKKLQRMQ